MSEMPENVDFSASAPPRPRREIGARRSFAFMRRQEVSKESFICSRCNSILGLVGKGVLQLDRVLLYRSVTVVCLHCRHTNYWTPPKKPLTNNDTSQDSDGRTKEGQG